MIRGVIDTNVLVSALLTSGGLPEAVNQCRHFGRGEVVCLRIGSRRIRERTQTPRLAIDSAKAADAIGRIRAIVSVVSPAVRVRAATDPDLNQFLACAEAAQAHYLVTRNIRHFPRCRKETRIVTPREFIDAWTAAPDDLL